MVVTITVPGPSLVIAAGVLWPLAGLVLVGLRLYARRVKSVPIALDDWLTVPAVVLIWGQGACLIAGVATKALAYPSPPTPAGVDPSTYNTFESRVARQLFWAIVLMQIPALTLIKLSFVFLYRRIFANHSRRGAFNIITSVLVVVLIMWAVAFWFCELFLCGTNFEEIWINKSLIDQTPCIELFAWDMALTSTDFVLDLIILVLPIPQIMKLELPRAQKWSLLGIFALGGLAIAASITRLVVFAATDEFDNAPTDDIDLVQTIALYWTVMETGLALLAACLPSIYGLFNSVRQNSRKNSKGYLNYTSTSNNNNTTWARQASVTSSKQNTLSEGQIHLTNEVRVDIENGVPLKDFSASNTHLTARSFER